MGRDGESGRRGFQGREVSICTKKGHDVKDVLSWFMNCFYSFEFPHKPLNLKLVSLD